MISEEEKQENALMRSGRVKSKNFFDMEKNSQSQVVEEDEQIPSNNFQGNQVRNVGLQASGDKHHEIDISVSPK